jgi:hypothetical protein
MELDFDQLENCSSEDICMEIREAARGIEDAAKDADTGFRRIFKKLRAQHPSVDEFILTPKAVTKKWLLTLGHKEDTILYGDFMKLFLDICAQEKRLDMETRTLTLSLKEAAIFQLAAGKPMSIFAFMASLPSAFK